MSIDRLKVSNYTSPIITAKNTSQIELFAINYFNYLN